MKYYCVLRTRLHSRTGHPPTHQSRLPIFLPWASKDQTNPTTANDCHSSLTTTDEYLSLCQIFLSIIGQHWRVSNTLAVGGLWSLWLEEEDLEIRLNWNKIWILETNFNKWRDRHFAYFETLWWNLLCMQISSQLPTSVVPWPNFLVKCS